MVFSIISFPYVYWLFLMNYNEMMVHDSLLKLWITTITLFVCLLYENETKNNNNNKTDWIAESQYHINNFQLKIASIFILLLFPFVIDSMKNFINLFTYFNINSWTFFLICFSGKLILEYGIFGESKTYSVQLITKMMWKVSVEYKFDELNMKVVQLASCFRFNFYLFCR